MTSRVWKNGLKDVCDPNREVNGKTLSDMLLQLDVYRRQRTWIIAWVSEKDNEDPESLVSSSLHEF